MEAEYVPPDDVQAFTPKPSPYYLKRKRDKSDEGSLSRSGSTIEWLHDHGDTSITGEGDSPSTDPASSIQARQPMPQSLSHSSWLMPPSPVEPPSSMFPADVASMRPFNPIAAGPSYLPPSPYHHHQRSSIMRSISEHEAPQLCRDGFDHSRVAADLPTPRSRSSARDIPSRTSSTRDSRPRNPRPFLSGPARLPCLQSIGLVPRPGLDPTVQWQVRHKARPQPIPARCSCGVSPRATLVTGPAPESVMEVLVCGISQCGFYIKLALFEQVRRTQSPLAPDPEAGH